MKNKTFVIVAILISNCYYLSGQKLSMLECVALQKNGISETTIYLEKRDFNRLPVDVALDGWAKGYVSSGFRYQKSGFYFDHIRHEGKDNWIDYTVDKEVYDQLLAQAKKLYFELSPTLYGLADKTTVVLFVEKKSGTYMVSIYNYYEMKAAQNQ